MYVSFLLGMYVAVHDVGKASRRVEYGVGGVAGGRHTATGHVSLRSNRNLIFLPCRRAFHV